jgi:hypothetical protein
VDLEADLINVSDKSNIYANSTISSKSHTIAGVLRNRLELDGVKLDIVIMQKKIDFINETVSNLANHRLQHSGAELADKNFAVILDEKIRKLTDNQTL